MPTAAAFTAYEREEHTQCNGGGTAYKVASVEQCLALCEQTASCAFVDYGRPDTNHNRKNFCYMMSACPNTGASAGNHFDRYTKRSTVDHSNEIALAVTVGYACTGNTTPACSNGSLAAPTCHFIPTANRDRIVNLETQTALDRTLITANTDDITDTRARLIREEAKSTAQGTSIGNNAADIVAAKQDISTVEKDAKANNGRIVNLESQAAQDRTVITANSAGVTDAKTRLAKEEAKIVAQGNDIGTLKSTLSTVEKATKDNNSKIVNLETQTTKDRTLITSNSNGVIDAKARLAKEEAKITAQGNDITAQG